MEPKLTCARDIVVAGKTMRKEGEEVTLVGLVVQEVRVDIGGKIVGCNVSDFKGYPTLVRDSWSGEVGEMAEDVQ